MLQGVLGLQKEAVMCINACVGSGCNKSLRHGALLRKLNTSSDSLVLPCFTLVTQKQQQMSCTTPRPNGIWIGARVSHKHVGG